MALAHPEQPPDSANDETSETYYNGQRSQKYQWGRMTKHCIGIIDTARFKMSGECPCIMDLLDDKDGKCGQKRTTAPQHSSEKSRLGSGRQLRLKLATKLLVFY